MHAIPGPFHPNLEQELQSKLDLARIVRSIACGSNLTEVYVVEVARVRNTIDAVASEVGCVEIRVVENVEEVRPELSGELVVKFDELVQREVQAMETRSNGLTRLLA